MRDPVNLLAPLTAQVAIDGRLLQADAPILRLHYRAGGIDGGVIAVPGLAAIAAVTHKIKMRLARSVYVADGEDDVELWVESRLAGDRAMLSISGWWVVDREIEWRTNPSDGTMPPSLHAAELLFDRNLRLVRLFGSDQIDIGPDHIGKIAADIFKPENKDCGKLLAAMERCEAIRADGQFLASEGTLIEASLEPQFNQQNEFSGYLCILSARVDPGSGGGSLVAAHDRKAHAAASPEPLFGRRLAPVLRQPLGRIIAKAETIGSKLQGPIRENYAGYAKDIANAARHLMALVDDLGDLEAIERPDFVTAPDDIELGDIARRVAGLLALKAADHRIDVTTPPVTERAIAKGEFRRVLQILINLVSNAIHYSPAGSRVSIDIEEKDAEAAIHVSDQGAGIAVEDREKIFEKFERLGRSGDGGSGLGLYISRRLARAMGGDLTVSKNQQGGAKFTLTLPTLPVS